MGKNKVIQLALGRTPEEEYKDNLRHLSKVTNNSTQMESMGLICIHFKTITGNVGLLFTNKESDEVER